MTLSDAVSRDAPWQRDKTHAGGWARCRFRPVGAGPVSSWC